MKADENRKSRGTKTRSIIGINWMAREERKTLLP